MPKAPDPSYKEGKVYKSQIKATQEWEKKNPMDKIIVRLPAGSREKVSAYVERKAAEQPDNPKYNSFNGKGYRPSVNAMIKNLLEEEIGEPLD